MLCGRSKLQKQILIGLVISSLLTLFYLQESVLFITINVPRITNELPLIYLSEKTFPTDEELLEEVAKTAPNLPVSFWNDNRNNLLELNHSCAHFPHLSDLKFNNVYWQTLNTSNGTFQLLNAFLDTREYNTAGATIRVLGMINKVEPRVTTYCHIWYEDKNYPTITKTEKYTYIWRKEWAIYTAGEYEGYLISCNVPNITSRGIPAAVSVVEQECDTASNILKIIYNTVTTKKDFAVCVKPLDFPGVDISVKLAEWIELLTILGADTIYFYKFDIHPNVTKLLNYYEMQGKVKTTTFELAGAQPNLPALRSYYIKKRLHRKRINEVVPYNDCFYQHMYEYKYITLLDIDEIIMPKSGSTWKELMIKLESNLKEEQASYSAQNQYFFDDVNLADNPTIDIPKYMHMLQHVYKSVNFTVGHYVKSFFNTKYVLTLHNHYPIACYNKCQNYDINIKYAQLQHYRSDCVQELKKKCSNIKANLIEDVTIWKYKKLLIENVQIALKSVGFL